MGVHVLFLMSAFCWRFPYADTTPFAISGSTEISIFTNIKNTDHVQVIDEDSMECAFGEFTKISTMCAHVQQCGNGLCQCCTDTKNRSYADCSGYVHEDTELSSIPPLPSGGQILKFAWNGLLSENINRTFFDNVRDLTHLFLSRNSLTYLHRSMFKKLRNLICLNVNGNLGLGENPEFLQEMLTIPRLCILSVSSCSFPLDNLQFNGYSTVKSLCLMNNPLRDQFEYNMTGLSTLVGLNLFFAPGIFFRNVYTDLPLQVRTLDLSTNALSVFPKTCSSDGSSLFPQLQTLNLDSNLIKDPHDFVDGFCLPNLMLLALDLNPISNVQSNTFSSKNFPSLQALFLMKQSNVISKPFRIQPKAFPNPSIRDLHLEHNDIWFGRRDLVAADAFDNLTNLRALYLDRTSFRDVDDDRFLELFGGLTSLQEFSLTDCQFEAVSTRTFQTLTRLTHLYLYGNLISYIPHKSFEPLQYLQLLDLSNNKLTFLSDQAFREGFQYTLQLGLRRNPFICSCELIWLRELYATESDRFVVTTLNEFVGKIYRTDTVANYKCDNLKGFSVSNFSLARQACLMSEQTNIMITYTCSLLVVALTAFLLLFAYRWHFRLLLYEAFRGNGQARRLRLQQNKFNYDVFVSYASEDLPWARRHLMSQLEDQLGLRLCIHERDFAIGNNIVDNIAECVESSKKILMVFSKSFVLSQWCQFELNYCLSHVLEYDDSLIIVCVDDVVSHEMTSAMMAVLKTTTYIQWMEEEYATESFWGRIKIALQEILNIGEHAV